MRRSGLIAGGLALLILLPVFVVVVVSDQSTSSLPSPDALADIPGNMLSLYESAATLCPGLSWTVLAGIGKIESNHDRSTAPGVQIGANYAGAEGPMQFEPGTWVRYGDGVPQDVYNPVFAVPAAARLLCANGAIADLPGALFAYNHALWYVAEVLSQAAAYGTTAAAGVTNTVTAETSALQLLNNPQVTLSPEARQDLASGIIDQRVIDFLNWASLSHTITVSVLKTGHTQYVEGTNRVSNHFYGRAADIAAVDGVPVSLNDPAAQAFALQINSLTSGRPDEVGTPWTALDTLPGYFQETPDHIHVGWFAYLGSPTP